MGSNSEINSAYPLEHPLLYHMGLQEIFIMKINSIITKGLLSFGAFKIGRALDYLIDDTFKNQIKI
jgi:hypothetical protein